jgi:hypothetical protein
VVAFSVPELDGAIKKLRHHGVDLPWGVEANSTCRWVMFHDPAGNLVEIVEFKSSRERWLAAPSHTTGHAGPHPAVQ